MSAIQFTTVIGSDGVIHPPAGVELPKGEMEVSIRPAPGITKDLEDRARDMAARHGFDWDAASNDVRAMLLDDARLEASGERRPRPAAPASL